MVRRNGVAHLASKSNSWEAAVLAWGGYDERVRGYEGVPGPEQPHKLHGSMNARQERVGPSAGRDSLCVFRIMRWCLYTPVYLPNPPTHHSMHFRYPCIAVCPPLVVLATVLDRRFGSGYGSEPTRFQIAGPGRQYTRTINSGTVRWTSQNPSQLGGLSAGCPAGRSVDSYNALVFCFIIIVCYQNRIFNIQ